MNFYTKMVRDLKIDEGEHYSSQTFVLYFVILVWQFYKSTKRSQGDSLCKKPFTLLKIT